MLILGFLVILACLQSAKTQTELTPCPTGDPVNCVCLPQSIVEYFNDQIIVSTPLLQRDPTIFQRRIEDFRCQKFVHLPPYLFLEMPLRKTAFQAVYENRRYRIKRSIHPHNGHPHDFQPQPQVLPGLGSPTIQAMFNALANMPKQKSDHYAPLGSEVTLHCFTSSEHQGKPTEYFRTPPKFEWKHANGLPITDALVILDQFTGDFKFLSVQLANTGVYNCTMVQEDNGVVLANRTYQSQLFVVAEPMEWLRFGVSYESKWCRLPELTLIQDQVRVWIHSYVCHFCSVRNVSVNCSSGGKHGSFVQISFAVSTVGFEALLAAWRQSYKNCPVECMVALHSKIIEVLTPSLIKLFRTKIVIQYDNPEQASVFEAIPETMDHEITMGCPAGFFHMTHNLCFPCISGQFSPHGQKNCTDCLEGHFQPNPGSSACYTCPSGTTHYKRKSVTAADCSAAAGIIAWTQYHWITTVIVIGVVLMLILIILICCGCPESGVGRCLRCTWCSKNQKSEREESSESEKLIVTTKSSKPNLRTSSAKTLHQSKSMQTVRRPRDEESEDEVEIISEKKRHKEQQTRTMRNNSVRRDSISSRRPPVPPTIRPNTNGTYRSCKTCSSSHFKPVNLDKMFHQIRATRR